jgi:hypothetical protein
MEKVCKNCECFVQRSWDSGKYLWGDCRKPSGSGEEMNSSKRGVFKWGNGTCLDFKPKQERESAGHRDSRSR